MLSVLAGKELFITSGVSGLTVFLGVISPSTHRIHWLILFTAKLDGLSTQPNSSVG